MLNIIIYSTAYLPHSQTLVNILHTVVHDMQDKAGSWIQSGYNIPYRH